MIPETTDPRLRGLLDRLMTLRQEARQTLLQARLAVAATDQLLRQTRAVLACHPVTADQAGPGPVGRPR